MMGVPSWLDIRPADYMHAVEAGDSAGRAIAAANQRADEQAFAQWMHHQELQQQAKDALARQELAQTGQQGLQDYRITWRTLKSSRSDRSFRVRNFFPCRLTKVEGTAQRMQSRASVQGRRVSGAVSERGDASWRRPGTIRDGKFPFYPGGWPALSRASQ